MNAPVRKYAVPVVALAAIVMTACAPTKSVSAAVKAERDRKPAPEFTLRDSNGREVKLSEYRGKVVLLNFWATWCGPCKIEIPWFIDFEQRFKDKGFAVLGISMDEEGWDEVKPYIENRKVNYRVVIGNDEIADQYGGVSSLPTTFLVDQTGRIASVHVGLVSKSVYQNEIEQLLEKKIAGAADGGSGAAAGAK